MNKSKLKVSRNLILSTFLLAAIIFSIVKIAQATLHDPGHPFADIGGGIVQGDLLYGSAADTVLALPKDTTASQSRYLSNTGASNNPAWAQVNAANGVSGLLPVANGGNGAAPGATDQILVSDSASAGTWKTLPDCSGNGKALRFNATTNNFDCNTLQFYNQSLANQGPGFNADTYVTGSSIPIPSTGMQAGTRYHALLDVTKTGAGTAVPTINVRFGTAGAVGDTSRCLLTLTAGTAAADTGTFEVWATFRSVGSGSSAVIQCMGQVRHRLTTTGLINAGAVGTYMTTGGGFDSTVANSIIGLSINGGTSASWTVTLFQAELTNLN
jgi:hypothetical protein